MTFAVDQLCFDLALADAPVPERRIRKGRSATATTGQKSFRLESPVHSRAARQARGAVSYQAGLAAEDQVARAYTRKGADLIAERWRGKGGEIDLVLRDRTGLIFVEVKRARTHDAAVARVTAQQVARLYAAAEEYVGTTHPGQMPDMRFDVATVDATGEIAIRPNAFA
ncbi:hypothetical protein PARPLA_02193 [Rhodobacteraceae bacterium THAF1]|uniref:YraN family protein n=1 Tax=Palleronia sp. THAF1 TaxID=2587842 RepID=UPI000F3E1BB5|nr:YraN family protein [Palleronia sp. THAF1]QFU07905.1 hypothetical protein FIU81_04370 [Palleronia sp. THAF1]VDC25739.1 hypothetical protein PARPLA_02193 [Rhodobacteraceae bacterium THAF1]